MTNEKETPPDRVWITWDDAYPWPTPEMGGTEYVRADLLATAWQPIETNPKDGTWQIVAKLDDNGKMVWWQRAYWRSKTKEWKTEGGYCVPTHWTPLPGRVLEAALTEK